MVIEIFTYLGPLLLGACITLLILYIQPRIVEHIDRQTEKHLQELMKDIESQVGKSYIRIFTKYSPWVSGIVLIALLYLAESFLAVVITIILAVIIYRSPFILQKRIIAYQNRRLTEQLPDAINSIANSLRAGESIPIAFKVVGTKFDRPISTVFRILYDRIEKGGEFDELLLKMIRILKIDSFEFFARALVINLKYGGPAYKMVTEIKQSVIEQDRCNRVILAATASGRYTIKFLQYSPLFILPFLSFLQPDWADLLFGSFGGILITMAAAGIYLFAINWAKDILAVEKI